MPELSYENIIQDLQKKIYYPIYLLSGEESYFIDSISNYIEENILDETEREFNQTILYGLDTEAGSLINLARSYPMSANYQVIILKEAQNLKDIGELIPYFENPSESTILVLAYKYKSLDKRKAVYKAINKKNVVFHSKKIWENKIPYWIQTQINKSHYKIGPREASLLADYLGNDLSKISGELKKLTINLKKGATITPEIIEENIGISKDFNIFSLTDALAAKNIYKANQIVNYFIGDEKNHSIYALLPMMNGFFYKSLVYYQLDNKTDRKSIAAKLGIHPGTVDRYIQCARNYKVMKLFDIIGYLKEADMKSKGYGATGNLSKGEILKELIFKILH
jgi:DNA polymerase-3 subunit delta